MELLFLHRIRNFQFTYVLIRKNKVVEHLRALVLASNSEVLIVRFDFTLFLVNPHFNLIGAGRCEPLILILGLSDSCTLQVLSLDFVLVDL